MTTTPTAAPATPVRTRTRRLRLFAPAFGLVAIIAYSSLSMPWYQATMSNATVLGTQNVSAHVTLTGHQLAGLASNPAEQGTTLGSSNPSAPQHFGIIDPVFWLFAALLLGALCSWSGSTLAGLGGLLGSFFAWEALLTIRTQVEQPRTWGSFEVVRGAGQSRLWFAMTLGLLMLAAVSLQSFLAKRHVRSAAKAQAAAQAAANPTAAPAPASTLSLLAKLASGALAGAASKVGQP